MTVREVVASRADRKVAKVVGATAEEEEEMAIKIFRELRVGGRYRQIKSNDLEVLARTVHSRKLPATMAANWVG